MTCFDLWDMCSLNLTYNEFLYVCIPYNIIVIYVHIVTSTIIYIYKAEKPFVRLSVCLSITSITRLGLPVSTHQVPNTKCSSSSYSKFVTTSSRVLPFALQNELKAKV